MSAPLKLVEREEKPGDAKIIRDSLLNFKEKFQPYRGD